MFLILPGDTSLKDKLPSPSLSIFTNTVVPTIFSTVHNTMSPSSSAIKYESELRF